MSPHGTTVLLLREPSTPPTPDRYESTFISAGYHPISLPVLETIHVNLPALKDIIYDGPEARGFAGVVITSKRSCEAWRMALDILNDGGKDFVHNNKDRESIPFYVVGNATAKVLQNAFASYPFKLEIDIRGQSSGNAAALSPFILSDIKERPTKLLFLTGDKNRDTLTNLLTEGGIILEPLQVYATEGSPRFAEQITRLLEEIPRKPLPAHWWIVYFAPSAAAFVTPILRKYFDIEDLDLTQSSSSNRTNVISPTEATQPQPTTTKSPRRTKVAAIGPSTNAFLLDNLGIRVHAMAHKPTPEEILVVIEAEDRMIR